jgi:DEAD/DEAH box helicase domain-containing protein
VEINNLLEYWKSTPSISGNVVELYVDEPRTAEYLPFPDYFDVKLLGALNRLGIKQLYKHQRDAVDRVANGDHVVVVTDTASGKTLCYNLPVIDQVLKSQDSTALYFFPTKALAQDQLSSLNTLSVALEKNIPAMIYDGDTPAEHRSQIRKRAKILLTNPDMLHIGILPHHTLWQDFFKCLKYIVIDEVHTYRGVFGSHVANLIRRLKRILAFYGTNPQFILTSATIANPGVFAEKLIEDQVVVIDQDGSPKGAKFFMLYNPPVVNQSLGLRKSPVQESVILTEDLLKFNIQSIVFARTRRTVEMLVKMLHNQSASNRQLVQGYRAGYLSNERRLIENALRSGETRVVVATNALELGIDIGGVDAVIMIGYPGTIASTRQRAGRAGRKVNNSIAILVASPNPLDQFILKHPEFLIGNSPEQALINPNNLLILLQHLKCAAFELPFKDNERFGLSPVQIKDDIINLLSDAGMLHHSANQYFWAADQYPANDISLRSTSEQRLLLRIEENGSSQTIGELELNSAYWMAHPDAVYLHNGQPYLVKELNQNSKRISIAPFSGDYYTLPKRQVDIDLVEIYKSEPVFGATKYYGEIVVTNQTVGYKKIQWDTSVVLGEIPLEMPKTTLRTTAYWIGLSDDTIEYLTRMGVWNSGQNDYGPNWAEQRKKALERDKYICQVCGIQAEKNLHVHHIRPFKEFTSSIIANQLDNLITLCPACHRRAEKVVKLTSGLSGIRYSLNNLAPLSLMCDIGDIGAHSDPQSPLSEGKPTIILFDLIPAGIGLSQTLYSEHAALIQNSYSTVAQCACDEGCPSCIGPFGENGMGSKQEAISILGCLNHGF